MKRALALLMCAFTLTLAACKDDETTGSEFRFETPLVTNISGTGVDVTCKALSGADVLAVIPSKFAYGLETEAVANYTEVSEVVVAGNTISCHLEGLEPETAYKVVAYLETGLEQLLSPVASFTTLAADPNAPVLGITSQRTIVAVADAANYAITYEVTNPTGDAKALASSESPWINTFDNSAAGTIAFKVDANPRAARTGVIVVVYSGASSVQVIVNQDAEADVPDEPGETIQLSVNSGFPKSYQTATVNLGDYKYTLSSVADYGNGIQFKKGSGTVSNAEDMGPITKVELIYNPAKEQAKKIALCLGNTPSPTGSRIEATVVDGTYTFDCSGTPAHYFSLVNGDGVSYVNTIKIYTGQGSTPPPIPGAEEPVFGTPSYRNLTKNSATITCPYTYVGEGAISEVYFLYRASAGTDQRLDQPAAQGEKSASLTALTPATLYTFRLCVVVEGKTYTSGSSTFVTNNEAGQPAGGTYKAGWAELPREISRPGDYYYAHHMRADAKSIRNFTVCYSKKYECPVWVAAPMHTCYTGGSGRNDSYRDDPDLGCSQVEKRTGYSRGHMLGSGERTVSVPTNKQVFYRSNIGPQLTNGFNQGNGVWNNLEEFVDGQWCADTLYQVIGCHWENTNKVASGTTIPTHYYKLLLRTKKGNSKQWVVNSSRDELKCVAMIVEHRDQKGVKPSRSMMKSVAELEAMTGFTFFANVPNAPKDTYNASDWGL